MFFFYQLQLKTLTEHVAYKVDIDIQMLERLIILKNTKHFVALVAFLMF